MATAIIKQKEVPEMDDVEGINFEDIRGQPLQTSCNTKENLDDRAGNGKAAGNNQKLSICQCLIIQSMRYAIYRTRKYLVLSIRRV